MYCVHLPIKLCRTILQPFHSSNHRLQLHPNRVYTQLQLHLLAMEHHHRHNPRVMEVHHQHSNLDTDLHRPQRQLDQATMHTRHLSSRTMLMGMVHLFPTSSQPMDRQQTSPLDIHHLTPPVLSSLVLVQAQDMALQVHRLHMDQWLSHPHKQAKVVAMVTIQVTVTPLSNSRARHSPLMLITTHKQGAIQHQHHSLRHNSLQPSRLMPIARALVLVPPQGPPRRHHQPLRRRTLRDLVMDHLSLQQAVDTHLLSSRKAMQTLRQPSSLPQPHQDLQLLLLQADRPSPLVPTACHLHSHIRLPPRPMHLLPRRVVSHKITPTNKDMGLSHILHLHHKEVTPNTGPRHLRCHLLVLPHRDSMVAMTRIGFLLTSLHLSRLPSAVPHKGCETNYISCD